MTPVRFKFLTPLGVPIADTPFYVSLNKAALNSAEHGFVHPEVVEGLTDAQGEATLTMFPANQPYYVTMDTSAVINDEQHCAAIRFRIAVPASTTEVWADNLVVTDPIFSQPWDAEAIEVIMQAKAAAAASATEAKASENAAKASEVSAAASAVEAANAAAGVDQAAAEAATSAAAALVSQQAAATSATHAADSATAALASQQSAAASATTAQGAATAAGQSATNAAGSATAAASSATNAGNSATAANQSKIDAAASATAAENSATAAAGSATAAQAAKTASETARDEAIAAAGSLTGVIADLGSWDASTGVYPSKPPHGSAFWKVTANGTVGGISYGIGDTLMYSVTLDEFYKIDNTESVSSVNGKTGIVVLGKADVGLPLADNTSDATKPISGPQQAALDGKQGLHANLTGLSATAAGVDRVPMFTAPGGAMTTLPAGVAGKNLLAAPDWDNVRALIEVTRPIATATKESGSFDEHTSPGWAPHIYRDGPLTNTPGTLLAAAQRPPYWYLHNTMYPNTSGAIVQVAYPYSIGAADKGSICWRVRFSGVWGTWQRALTMQDITSSNTDGTPGKLLTNGNHGIGGITPSLLETNINALRTTGFYYVNRTGAGVLPVDTNGYLTSQVVAVEYAVQSYRPVTATTSYERWLINSVWSPWKRMYNNENAIGTVAFSGGENAGALIERGSGANGNWTKFADGTMVCRARFDVDSVAGNSNRILTWTYPAVFNVAPVITVTPLLNFSNHVGPCIAYADVGTSHTATSTRAIVRNLDTAAQNIGASIIAQGFWR